MEFRFVITKGVENLDVGYENLKKMYNIAKDFYKKSYMTVFKPENGKIVVSDGNENVLTEIEEDFLQETVWIIGDDYGDFILLTALLPEEY